MLQNDGHNSKKTLPTRAYKIWKTDGKSREKIFWIQKNVPRFEASQTNQGAIENTEKLLKTD
jgi:hypothetical protein